jgi:hypothetical protein
MSRVWAIPAITEAIGAMLEERIPDVDPSLEGVVISTLPVDEVAPDPGSCQLNLSLFRVQSDTTVTGLPRGRRDAVGPPLSLGYLLSVSDGTPASLGALGAALTVLNEHPTLQSSDVGAEAVAAWSARVVELPLALGEASALWQMLAVPYRPSITLDVLVRGGAT